MPGDDGELERIALPQFCGAGIKPEDPEPSG